jgi:hypothetical protein
MLDDGADIRPGSDSSVFPFSPFPTNVNGTLFFSADDGFHGVELWKLVPLALGDVNRDGKRTVADISALMGALADLSAYQSANGLYGPDLLAVADTSGDDMVTNADVQGLINLLANAGGGAGSTSTSAATAPVSLAPAIATDSDSQRGTPAGTTPSETVDGQALVKPIVSRLSADRRVDQRLHSTSIISSKRPQPSLKTALIDQAISTFRHRHARRHSTPAAPALNPLDHLLEAWR